MKKLLLGVVALATLTFTSCSDDDDTPANSRMSLDLTGLENLGDNYAYEGWIIVNGSPISTGTFSVDDSGILSKSSFDVNTSLLSSATNFVLSIEPVPDNDPNPANTKILAGEFNGNTASVNSDNIVVASVSAIGSLGESTGKFILATPTDSDNTNEASGVWFLDNSSGSAMAGLSLPTLSAGWKYEGWAVIDGTPVTTGTFTNVAATDEAAPFSGPNALPMPNGLDGFFPGEDFLTMAPNGLTFPTDLKGKTIVISVEPDPDNSPAPFTLKPLAKIVDANAMNHTVINMGAGPVAVLSGSVTRN